MNHHPLALLAAAAVALTPLAARAQGYDHGPVSSQASHTPGSEPSSPIAPRLPDPAGGDAGSAEGFLRQADQALAMHKTGLAQQSLEMAETRMLDRSTLTTDARQPDSDLEVEALRRAREALGRRDIGGARAAIRQALNNAEPPGYRSPPPGG